MEEDRGVTPFGGHTGTNDSKQIGANNSHEDIMGADEMSSDEQDEKMDSIPPPLISIIYIVVALSGLLYSAIMFGTSLSAYINVGKTPLYLSATVTNWEAHMITDIKAVEEDHCPTGYEPMVEREWPGTFAGCDCRNNPDKDDIFRSGSCPKNCAKIDAQ